MVSFRIIARRILGRRGTFLLRNILSELYFLIHHGNDLKSREDGITAMVCTYNEEDWIKPSLLSIKDLADEYIVVDSSTDSTPQIISQLKYEHGLPIRLFKMRAGDLVSARNLVLKEARYKWILHWDADFIAKPELIDVVKKLVVNLDRRRHYLVYWQMIRLCGDIYHVCENPYHVEHWLFTWSSKLRYKWVGKYDSLIAPLYMYKAIYIEKPLGLHLTTVRNPKRLFIKWIWWKYRQEADEYARSKGSVEDFVKSKAKELYGVEDIEEAGKILIKEMTSKLPQYKESLFGELPALLLMRARELGLIS